MTISELMYKLSDMINGGGLKSVFERLLIASAFQFWQTNE